MKNLKYIILLLLCPVLMASYGEEPEAQQARFGPESYPSVTGFWPFAPTVKVCRIASVSESRVRKAISYWTRLGYEFDEIIFDDESMSCATGPMFGEIIITLPGQDFDFSKLAITRTARNIETGFIIHSKIQLPPVNESKERVLEHEIGHALGWGHTFRMQHLMNEDWRRGGHDSTGMTYQRYIELSNELMAELTEN